MTSSTTLGVCAAPLPALERTLVLGDVIDGAHGGANTYNFRTVHFPYGAIQHNRIERPGTGGNNLSAARVGRHADRPAELADAVRGDLREPLLGAGPGHGFMRTCQSNTCDSAAPYYTDVQHVLVERNFFTLETGGVSDRAIPDRHFMGGDITIRNNIVDAQGVNFSQSGSRTRLVAHGPSLGTGLNQTASTCSTTTLYLRRRPARARW